MHASLFEQHALGEVLVRRVQRMTSPRGDARAQRLCVKRSRFKLLARRAQPSSTAHHPCALQSFDSSPQREAEERNRRHGRVHAALLGMESQAHGAEMRIDARAQLPQLATAVGEHEEIVAIAHILAVTLSVHD